MLKVKQKIIFFIIRKVQPYLRLSYSQVGEDKILQALCPKIGFYIEVGSNHPIRCSNSYLLYLSGWKGIVIDANNKLIELFKKERTQDIAFHALVSNKEDYFDFVEFNENLVSSVDEKHIQKFTKDYSVVSKTKIKSRTLTSILDELNAPSKFNLLIIDAEGHDFSVLVSLDLNKYKPDVIMIEIHDFNLENPESNEIYQYLSKNNYKLVAYAIMNAYFCHQSSF